MKSPTEYRNIWMHLLPDKVKMQSINSIILPGVSYSRIVYLDESKSPRKITKVSWIPCIQNHFVLKILSESMDVYKLLMNGVRFFDLKLNCIDGKYFIKHSVFIQSLSCVLDQFKSFLQDHISEIVVVQLVPETNFDKKIDLEIENMFKTHFENILVPQKFYFPSYQEIIDQNQQMLFSYQSINCIPPDTCNWKRNFFSNVHILSDEPLSYNFKDTSFNHISISSVSDFSDFVSDIVSERFKCFRSKSIQEYRTEQIDEFLYNIDRKNVSSITLDFPQIDNISTIIRLNFKK
jgi:hypothetical protein